VLPRWQPVLWGVPIPLCSRTPVVLFKNGLICLTYLTFKPYLTLLNKVKLTRFAQPHVHMYMFCPYVISTLSKDTFLVQLFSQLYT
jgi:hypothetical protein